MSRRDKLFPCGLRRSSALPFLVIVLLMALPSFGYALDMRGRFSTLKRPSLGSDVPELCSITILPGLGMDVLQITASLPERGEVQPPAAPTVEDMERATTSARIEVSQDWMDDQIEITKMVTTSLSGEVQRTGRVCAANAGSCCSAWRREPGCVPGPCGAGVAGRWKGSGASRCGESFRIAYLGGLGKYSGYACAFSGCGTFRWAHRPTSTAHAAEVGRGHRAWNCDS